jgi:hypothetical protein
MTFSVSLINANSALVHGMMEYWIIGIMGSKEGQIRLIGRFPQHPSFQYSITPTFKTEGTHQKGGDFEDGNNRRRERPAACLLINA